MKKLFIATVMLFETYWDMFTFQKAVNFSSFIANTISIAAWFLLGCIVYSLYISNYIELIEIIIIMIATNLIAIGALTYLIKDNGNNV